MSEIFDLPTLIILVVAVIVLLRLRSVLGQRTGYQAPPPDLSKNERTTEQTQADGSDNVVPINGKGKKGGKKSENPAFAAINKYAKSGTKLNRGLKEIADADQGFSPEGFLSGAKMAYEMIVTAFNDGDAKALKNLLSKEVYDGFADAIKDRNKRGDVVKATFVGIDNSDIKSAGVSDGEAHVTVQFLSQIITSTEDKDGKVIEGDAEEVIEVNDIWTFARSVKSRDPNWKLVATESDD